MGTKSILVFSHFALHTSHFLSKEIKEEKVDFQIKALIIAFIITVGLALSIIPILKKLKVGQIERDDGPESHLKKQGTPTMGGIIMIIAAFRMVF